MNPPSAPDAQILIRFADPLICEKNWSALADDFRTLMADATWAPLPESLLHGFEPALGP